LWKELPEEDRAPARKAIDNLLKDVRNPPVRFRELANGIREAEVSQILRMSFQVENDTIILRDIGRNETSTARSSEV
jgi:hypothetical protein